MQPVHEHRLSPLIFFTQVNRCHVFACPTWPQAKATIWQLNDFVRWKHKIGALSSWNGALIVVFSADPFADELSLVMFFLDVGSLFVSWSGSACRCFANWACLETVVTARRNRGERRSQRLTFHLTLQVNSFRWCSYMHEESHGRRFRCGASYNFNLPWQTYVMCKISYVLNYIYDKHQDNFKTDILCDFGFLRTIVNIFPFASFEVSLRERWTRSGFPCAGQSKWTFGTHVDSLETKKHRGTKKAGIAAREVKKKNRQNQNHQIQKLHHALMKRWLFTLLLEVAERELSGDWYSKIFNSQIQWTWNMWYLFRHC